ncbi:MAG: hypothetical protein HOM34_06830 [Planctomycetes bacterium]|jgi:hypothetical protein|nr:hypothetical protein [Planctomycetota bacterium]MBT4560023.1 hypothetical protein [Planctomycetota bacterium]MBT5100467.1 hypothetical protein [Planctomycetota bacterium]MBT5120418.1 hypothetical protein [Planctomycetota bacterium]MBT7318597.1 hypothetical protein [Planctomycetota bacterium]
MRRLLVLLSLAVCLPASALAQSELPNGGYEKAYTIAADAAWLGSGRVLSPAFVRIENGAIAWVRSTPPSAKKSGGLFGMGGSTPSKPIRVQGTLAPGLVDAWSRLLPEREMESRNHPAWLDVLDSLPEDFAGEDLALSGRIAAARQAGIAAAYVSFASGPMQRGQGTAVVFSTNDLPLPAGRVAYEIVGASMHSSSSGASLSAGKIRELFTEAQDWRDSWDEYDEKVEKYDKAVEEYPGKIEEWAKERDDYKAKIDDGITKDDKGKDLKEPKQPKSPKRPRQPRLDPAQKPIFDAIDGRVQVRFEVQTADEIAVVLELTEQFDLDSVLVSARDADLLAAAIADADVPVILACLPEMGEQSAMLSQPQAQYPPRSFTQRYMALTAAGVDVALGSGASDGVQALMLMRAGELIAAGADADGVWASLTSIPARILGLDPALGRIGSGASASMIRFEGDSPFDASAAVRAHKPR